jgi:hypothetical protein
VSILGHSTCTGVPAGWGMTLRSLCDLQHAAPSDSPELAFLPATCDDLPHCFGLWRDEALMRTVWPCTV